MTLSDKLKELEELTRVDLSNSGRQLLSSYYWPTVGHTKGATDMAKRTVIVEVRHENGDRATAIPWRPTSTLFEVCDGPHAGKRGADSDLFDLCGPLDWRRDTISIYETGEHVTQ